MDMTSPALPVRLISTRARQVLLSLADLQASTWWMEQGPACTHMRCTTSRLTCSRPLCGLVLDSLLAQQLSLHIPVLCAWHIAQSRQHPLTASQCMAGCRPIWRRKETHTPWRQGSQIFTAVRGSHSLDRILMNMSPGLSRLKPLDQSQSAPAGRMQILDA